MTDQERIANLEQRIEALERLTSPMVPLGPRKETEEERNKSVERVFRTLPSRIGWYCENCKKCHSPDTIVCPDPPIGGSLKQRLKEASNG